MGALRRRAPLSLVVLALALAGLPVLAAQSACNAFSLPTRACLADGMNVSSAAASGGDDPCQSCLQARCCDAVGECQRVPGCSSAVKETHACVLDGGKPQAAEPLCTPRLRSASGPTGASAADAAVDTYACLRTSCQAECGLPTCRFGPDVPSFLNGACDLCIEATCCEPVAQCANDRRCRAALDCIATRCPAEEAAIFAGTAEASAVAELERASCDPGAAGAADAGGLPCVRRCFDLFVPAAPPRVVSEALEVRCDAARVIACGARAGCGASCTAFFAVDADGGE
jgi:hypothetical protein